MAFGMIALPSPSIKASLPLPLRGWRYSNFSASLFVSSSSSFSSSSSSSTLESSSRIVEREDKSSSSQQHEYNSPPHTNSNNGRRKREPTSPSAPSSQGMTIIKNNNNNKESSPRTSHKRKIIDGKEEHRTPWNADYATSLRTQRRIQTTAAQAEANIIGNSHNHNNNHHRRHSSNDYNSHDNDDDAIAAKHAKQAICTILQTLHDTPPELCNAANIVCALTLSSKIWERSKTESRTSASSSSYSSSTTKANNSSSASNNLESNKLYVTLLTQTLTTLSYLVSIPNQLSPRQLCNAAWSLAKFVLHDEDTFNKYVNKKLFGGRYYSSGSSTSVATTTMWNMRQEYDQNNIAMETTSGTEGAMTVATSNQSMDELIDEVFNLIAQRVIEHLELIQRRDIEADNGDDDDDDGYKSSRGNTTPPYAVSNIIRPGEISMLLWAYAIVGPRNRPPGWESPRKMERLSSVVSLSSIDDDNVSVSSSGSGSGVNSNENDSGVKVGKMTGGSDSTSAAENYTEYVTFVKLDSFSTSNGDFNDKTYYHADALESPLDCNSKTVDTLFDAVAIAFSRGVGVNMMAADMVEENHCRSLLSNCTWRELSNIAWSFATRGAYKSKESERMMSLFANEATSRIRSCVLGSSKRNDTDGASTKASACKILPRDSIQIAWALGIMESDNVDSGDALLYLVDSIHDYWIDDSSGSTTKKGSKQQQQQQQQRPLRPFAHWTCADLVQLATAMAHGRLDNQSVLESIFRESLERISSSSGGRRGGGQHQRHKRVFSTAEISILMWVQARLYLTPKIGDVYAIFPSVASRELLRRMGSNDVQLPNRMRQMGLGPQEQANLAWSLTVLENYSDSVVTLLQYIFHAASSLLSSSSPFGKDSERIMQLEHAHQLWQSYFLLSKDFPDATKFVPAELRNYLEDKWKLEKSRSKQSSSRHKAISQTLNLMKVAHRNEYEEDVDVAIVLEENSAWTHTAQNNFDSLPEKGHRKVAVEFDGPHHFTRSASTERDLLLIESGAKIIPRVLGHTVLKYRLLKRKGWTVIRIPYYEFDKIPFWASMVSVIPCIPFI